MISFKNDYSEGACPEVLEALVKTNYEQTVGYGEDEYCEEARNLIKENINYPNADIYFLVGGTQANTTVISHSLKPYEAVIACKTGHISIHETGAIEATGHKIIEVDGIDGKLTPNLILNELRKHEDHHMVKPKMVYISNTTEIGTVYTKSELENISKVCKENNLYLYLDGARLASALASEKCDVNLEDYPKYCDVFYIGGTKCGLLFGEAVVIINDEIKKEFQFSVKQKGGLFAKGRLLGIQFATLFKDDLYYKIGVHSNKMGLKIKNAFAERGIKLATDSYTNQVFVDLNPEQIKKLEKDVIFSVEFFGIGESQSSRFVTSWATKEEDVDRLVELIKNL
ncbi:low specificity L-threonine aldolase [Fusobacterium animalis]|uniref:threonine aldolase family protein n=1 Tax=Fusobacterium animalis TaxID=76859 RepID=UPI00041C2E43|nr:low specificity L-threonine aldolase [Fusobacterium animalis]ALF21841.1 amino acid lyase [Fusobacterium animalis]